MFKSIIGILVWVWSHVYTYGVNQWFQGKRGMIYSLWVSQFIGEVGEKTHFGRPLLLQGGGQRKIKVGSYTGFGHHTVLGCWEHYKNVYFEPEIIIGDNCSIGDYCHITAINKIIIGDGLLTGRFVYIGDNAHGSLSIEESDTPPAQRHLISKGEIKIGRNVWIGDRVSILGGVTIGDNVIIGAGSIVTHNIPSNCLATGVPANVVKTINASCRGSEI